MAKKKMIIRWKKYGRYIFGGIGILMMLFLFYTFVIKQPTNDRVWETGFERETRVMIKGDELTFTNFRDFRFTKGKIESFEYLERKVNLSDVQKVWFIQEPFVVQPFTAFTGVAHTYFVFDVKEGNPIAVSVEARREKDERYSAFAGAFNTFELSYIWGSEKDLTGQRIFNQNNTLYMFPMTMSQDQVQKLFLAMVEETNILAEKPRFYNTITSNCTNELTKRANKANPGMIPLDIALIFPGYSDQFLYKLGLIPTDQSLKDIRKKYFISQLAREAYKSENFSVELRELLR